jgi:prolycopene isomerase
VGTPVEQILVEDGRVAGVRLGSGREIRAEAVVSNADARTTLEQYVGVEHLPRSYATRLARMRPSQSGVVLYAATDADVTVDGLAAQEFVLDTWDHDEAFEGLRAGRPAAAWLNTPTIHDRSLAPDGHHILILTVLAPYEIDGGWDAQQEAYRERLLAVLEHRVPSLRGRVTHAELATPPVFQRFTGATGGALYGWDATPNQSGSRRLSRFTPVGGLFLSGHWTQPGMSTFRAVYSGIETAMAVAGSGYAEAFLRSLELVP